MNTTKQIDPRTARRAINGETFEHNSALFGQYCVIARHVSPTADKLESVVIEKKPEYCAVKS